MAIVIDDYDGVWGMQYLASQCSFRPLVLLNSNFQLEKVKYSNNNDAFKIVAK